MLSFWQYQAQHRAQRGRGGGLGGFTPHKEAGVLKRSGDLSARVSRWRFLFLFGENQKGQGRSHKLVRGWSAQKVGVSLRFVGRVAGAPPRSPSAKRRSGSGRRAAASTGQAGIKSWSGWEVKRFLVQSRDSILCRPAPPTETFCSSYHRKIRRPSEPTARRTDSLRGIPACVSWCRNEHMRSGCRAGLSVPSFNKGDCSLRSLSSNAHYLRCYS